MAAKAGTVKNCKYRFLTHVTPTSAVVERLFSRAMLIITPHRGDMDPSTLEVLLPLGHSKDLWGATTLDEFLSEFAAEILERIRAREEQEVWLNL